MSSIRVMSASSPSPNVDAVSRVAINYSLYAKRTRECERKENKTNCWLNREKLKKKNTRKRVHYARV